jgi:hypothetical protein
MHPCKLDQILKVESRDQGVILPFSFSDKIEEAWPGGVHITDSGLLIVAIELGNG